MAVIEETKEVKKTDLITDLNNLPVITPGFGSIQSFEFTQRAATLLANSTLVPKEYQKNLPNCVIALNMAARIGADPLMVMQSLYIVNGRPAWASQFMIATFNTCGRFSAIRYKWVGERGTDSFGCFAYATEKATGEVLQGSTVTIEIAKAEGWFTKSGSKWNSLPDQMLMYRAASWFVRAYAPELAMGMHTAEEVIDITPEQIDIIAETISQKANKELVEMPGPLDGFPTPASFENDNNDQTGGNNPPTLQDAFGPGNNQPVANDQPPTTEQKENDQPPTTEQPPADQNPNSGGPDF